MKLEHIHGIATYITCHLSSLVHSTSNHWCINDGIRMIMCRHFCRQTHKNTMRRHCLSPDARASTHSV